MTTLTIILYPDHCAVASIVERADHQVQVKRILASRLSRAGAERFVSDQRQNKRKYHRRSQLKPRLCRICGETFQPHDYRTQIGPCCLAQWRRENVAKARAAQRI